MRRLWRRVALAILVAGFPSSLRSQGLAGAAVDGLVTRLSGEPVAQARVVLRNTSTGFTREQQSRSSGRYVFEGVPPGGPYELRAFALGLDPARSPRTFTLALGDRVTIDLAFPEPAPTVLPTAVVRGEQRLDEGGPSFAISSDLVHGLPLLNRDFTGLFATIPQAVVRNGDYSVSGQLPALNAIQIDGGIANDVYGVSRTPGKAAGAKSISLEALDQIQVLVAPFDVRQGAFTGALINGITRSGTNRWQASVFTSVQDQSLVGKDTAGAHAGEFSFLQYGATVGGPIVSDKLHLFAAADIQRSRTPFLARPPAAAISWETAAKAATIFRDVYGFDAGGPEAPVLSQPDRSVFAKLTWQPSSRHRIELSHNWVDAWNESLSRDASLLGLRPIGWELSGSGMVTSDVVHTTRLRATSAFGSLGNELTAGLQTIDEDYASSLRRPLFLVQGEGGYLAGGSVVNATGTVLDQRVAELTDNVTLPLGSHELTGGMHAEWYRFTDDIFPSSWGIWWFPSVDALARQQADSYQVALPGRPNGPLAQFGAGQVAAYLQDRWTPIARLSVTAGVRADRPHSDVAPANGDLASSAALGDGYSRRFSTATQLSPRLGLSWRASERHAVVVRAGAGMYAARAPQVWLGGSFANTGIDQSMLTCTAGQGVPGPVIDVDRLPQQCAGPGSSPPTPTTTATYISQDFRAPQVWKSLVGIDATLAWGTSVSLDVVRTDARNQTYIRDVNLTLTGTNAEGRTMYGTVTSNGKLRPTRPDPAFGQVLELGSRGADRGTALSVSASKRWSNGSIAQVGYQWSRATDAMTLFNPGAMLAFQNSPIDGTIDSRRQALSGVDIPHSLVASAIARLPFALSASFLLRAQSGQPYAYTVRNDVNADGVGGNDLLYVPRDSADISLRAPEQWSTINAYIDGEACLREQRGRLMARNSCRNPAFITLDTRVAKSIMLGVQRLEVGLDVFNVANLLNHDWGIVRSTATGKEGVPFLTASGWDAAANRPMYALANNGKIPARRQADLNASRWRIQLGMRYWPR